MAGRRVPNILYSRVEGTGRPTMPRRGGALGLAAGRVYARMRSGIGLRPRDTIRECIDVATLVPMKIVQVKIPCTDLRVSAGWYSALLGLKHHREFVEEGEVAGVVLAHPEGWVLGLRLRTRVPGQPAFQGFDLFSLSVEDRGELEAVKARATSLGGRVSKIIDRGSDGPALDVFDPDGTAIRFLSPGTPETVGFVGVEFQQGLPPTFYDERRV